MTERAEEVRMSIEDKIRWLETERAELRAAVARQEEEVRHYKEEAARLFLRRGL